MSGDVETNPGPQFEIKECRTRGLKVCHLNARSLLPKIDNLRLFINKNPFDVIAIPQIWLKPSVTNAEINITNYSIARQDRKDITGRGTVIYVRDGLPYRSRADLQKNDIETTFTRGRTNSRPYPNSSGYSCLHETVQITGQKVFTRSRTNSCPFVLVSRIHITLHCLRRFFLVCSSHFFDNRCS